LPYGKAEILLYVLHLPYFYPMYHPDLREAVAAALKEKTMHAHKALEALLIPSLRQITTTAEYVRLLQTFYGFFSPLEGIIEHYLTPRQLPDIRERRKASFLLNDITALGFSTEHLATTSHLPLITKEAQAWGALYVLEGSTLGGRGITRMLLKQCGALSLNQLTFFNGYGEATGPMWLRFQEALNGLDYSESEVATTVQAANDTFLNFKKWIEETLA
jgi:heme oxygenase (biliverdin-IX-beta and delta-forming)